MTANNAVTKKAEAPSAAVAEQCRALAKMQELKASKSSAVSSAVARLMDPLASLDGLQGLPREMVHRCAVIMRGEEASELVPEGFKRQFSTGVLQKWTEQALLLDGSAACRQPRKTLARGHSSGTGTRKALAQSTSPARTSSAAALNPTKQALALLETWVSALRPIVPCGTLPSTIAALVHGADAQLPPDPVGAELRRLVPQEHQLGADGTWVFLKELEAALDLEKQFIRSSVMHAEIPAEIRRRRPSSASAVSGQPRRDKGSNGGRLQMSFPQAFKNTGGGGMRITAIKGDYAMGQMPRAPRTCEVPGPGFYVDKSLQRAVCNPANGEFASAGKLRTCCPVNTMSITTRFGEVDLARVGPLQRPSSAPCLRGGRGSVSDPQRRVSRDMSSTSWGRLLD